MSNITLFSIAQHIYDIADTYEFYISIFIMIAGLISNTFIILILTRLRVFRDNQCAFYLTVECLADIGLLSVILPSRILAYKLGIDPVHLSIVWCKIRSWTTQVFAFISLLKISFATLDQYLLTNYRYSFRQMSTIKLAYCLTFFTVCFGIIHNIYLLILTDIHPMTGCAVYNLILKNYFSYFYYPVITSFLPVFITSSFSLLAYRNVRRIIRRQIPIVRLRLDRQLTAMVFARVISLLTLGLPYIIYSLCINNISINENNYLGLAINRLIDAIMLSMFYSNYSFNFYIFIIISSRFCNQIKYFLRKKLYHRIRSNQVVPKTHPQTISVIDV